MARLSKHIGSHQERIINRAAVLSQNSAQQVMIPIEQVSMLSTGQTVRHDGVEFVVRRVRRGRIFEASASMKRQS